MQSLDTKEERKLNNYTEWKDAKILIVEPDK